MQNCTVWHQHWLVWYAVLHCLIFSISLSKMQHYIVLDMKDYTVWYCRALLSGIAGLHCLTECLLCRTTHSGMQHCTVWCSKTPFYMQHYTVWWYAEPQRLNSNTSLHCLILRDTLTDMQHNCLICSTSLSDMQHFTVWYAETLSGDIRHHTVWIATQLCLILRATLSDM